VTIPSSVTSIGDQAFSGCSRLTSVTVPDGVTRIEWRVFYGCSRLTSVTISSGVTSIGDQAFYGCSGLARVTIPSGVTSIGDQAFYGCSGLARVTIPSSVTSIGAQAFYGCSGLGYGVVIVDGCVLTVNGTCQSAVEIPQGTRLIADFVFSNRSGLTRVAIPSSVMSFGNNAFSDCSGLASVTISEGVPSIGNFAFYGCRGLTSVTIPSSVTSIGERAFSGCSGLGDGVVIVDGCVLTVNGNCQNVVEIPQGTRLIADDAFSGCSGLTSVTIPSSVTSIGARAFYRCSGLTRVTIPLGVTSIGRFAFVDCWQLASVDFECAPPDGVGMAFSVDSVRYNIKYAAEWLPVVEACGWTDAKPYTPGQPEMSEPEIQDWVASDLGTRFAKSGESPEQYQARFEAKFGESYTAAFDMETGKVGPDEKPLCVWHDYVAGTDPLDLSSQFKASVTIVDGKPVVSYTPELNETETARRTYVTYGKENLQDTKWLVVPKGQEYKYNFFKVTVDLLQ